MNKTYVASIRNKKDGTVYSKHIVDSISDFCKDISIFLGGHPETAFAMFREDYEVIYTELDYGRFDVIPMPEPVLPPSEA